MKFSETFIGQPVIISGGVVKFGYIKRLSFVREDEDDNSIINTEIYVDVDLGEYIQEYDIRELTSANGNM